MKNLFKILFISAALVGCEDSLERLPVDQLVPATAYRDVNDLERGVSSVYNAYGTYFELAVNSIATDETTRGEANAGQELLLHNLNIDASSGQQSLYFDYSRLANLASRVIANSTFITVDPTNTADVAKRDNLVGQAYAMRAFAYFKMFEYFTPDYSNPTGLSVPYIDFVAVSSTFPARETVTGFTTKFNADLTTATSLLGTSNGIVRINPNFVKFLRARHALATGANLDAINIATDLIDNSGTRLANRTEYVNMFADLDNNEVIFKRDYTINDARIAGPYVFTGSGGEKWVASTGLRAAVNATNDPARNRVLFVNGVPGASATAVGKYPGSGGIPYLNDMKEMRISELYLIRAEAHARRNELVAAAGSVKALRDARLVVSPALSYSSDVVALDDILNERRIELAFEGHRYKDLKRYKRGYTRNDADCADAATPCTLSITDRQFTLPIPLTEVNNNPNITGNNPGY